MLTQIFLLGGHETFQIIFGNKGVSALNGQRHFSNDPFIQVRQERAVNLRAANDEKISGQFFAFSSTESTSRITNTDSCGSISATSAEYNIQPVRQRPLQGQPRLEPITKSGPLLSP